MEGSRFSQFLNAHTEPSAIRDAISIARHTQSAWSERPVRKRLHCLDSFQKLIIERDRWLAEAISIPQRVDFRETLSSELLPLASAVSWLRSHANAILAPRRLRMRDIPLWMGRVSASVYREPLGVVMVIGTWNYPLFLPGVQILQALAAGNAVVFKPAPNCEVVAARFCELLVESGVPKSLLVLMDSTVASAKAAIDCGVDKVFLTGSSATGRKLLSSLGERLTPATLELSGCDPVFVLPTADMNRLVDCLAFGLSLNSSATCMAPRRVFVPRKMLENLETRLSERTRLMEPRPLHQSSLDKLRLGLAEAIYLGARLIGEQPNLIESPTSIRPLVLSSVHPSMNLAKADLFAPLVMLLPVDDWSEAIQLDSQCPYALSASVFGDAAEAEIVAREIDAGMVTINDIIVESAVPELPFGGRGESGYGVTRGREGLLEMTRVKTVAIRRGNWLPHLLAPSEHDETILSGLMRLLYGDSLRTRWHGFRMFIDAARKFRNSADTINPPSNSNVTAEQHHPPERVDEK